MRHSYRRSRPAFERTDNQPVRQLGKLSLILSGEPIGNVCELSGAKFLGCNYSPARRCGKHCSKTATALLAARSRVSIQVDRLIIAETIIARGAGFQLWKQTRQTQQPDFEVTHNLI
jgi:hypothetical protein